MFRGAVFSGHGVLVKYYISKIAFLIHICSKWVSICIYRLSSQFWQTLPNFGRKLSAEPKNPQVQVLRSTTKQSIIRRKKIFSQRRSHEGMSVEASPFKKSYILARVNLTLVTDQFVSKPEFMFTYCFTEYRRYGLQSLRIIHSGT